MADDRFKDSLAGLSRALGERVASHPDPVGEAMERRASVQAQFEAQEGRRRWLLGGVAAALASAGVTVLILFLVWPPGAPSPLSPTQGSTSGPPSATAATVAAPDQPPPPPVIVAAVAPSPPPPSPEPDPVLPAEPPPPGPLARDEVREVQKRLVGLGFDPGPVDGESGRLTEAAVSRYQEKRALPPTGKPDRALLEQLRQDPAPKVDPLPQVVQRSPQRTPPPRNASGPLDFLRTADGNISRWLNSLSR